MILAAAEIRTELPNRPSRGESSFQGSLISGRVDDIQTEEIDWGKRMTEITKERDDRLDEILSKHLSGVVEAIERSMRKLEEELRRREMELQRKYDDLRLEDDQNKLDLLQWFTEEIRATFKAYARWSKSAAGRDPNINLPFSPGMTRTQRKEANQEESRIEQEKDLSPSRMTSPSREPREGERPFKIQEDVDLTNNLRLMPEFLREHATPGRSNKVPFLGLNKIQRR